MSFFSLLKPVLPPLLAETALLDIWLGFHQHIYPHTLPAKGDECWWEASFLKNKTSITTRCLNRTPPQPSISTGSEPELLLAVGFMVAYGKGEISHNSMNQFCPFFYYSNKKWQETNFSDYPVVSDSSNCPRVVTFHIVSAQGCLHFCYVSVWVSHATTCLSCLWPSVGVVAEFIEQTRKCIVTAG